MFIWASCCSAMGMSNFLIFPSHCAKHGGLIVFMIPYLFFIVFISLPLTTLSLGLGQKHQNGNVWPKISTKLAGIGYANAYVALTNMVTYSLIISWTLLYFINSFKTPWISEQGPYDFKTTTNSSQVYFPSLYETDASRINHCGDMHISHKFMYRDILMVYDSECVIYDTSLDDS